MSEVLIASQSVTGPTPARFADLKDQVALILGRQLDQQSLYRCGQFINRVIKELNTRPWKALLTTGTPITTSSTVRTYSLDSLFFKESKVQRLDDASKPAFTLQYLDWEQYQARYDRQTDSGAPYMYTLRNVDQDGIIDFYPVPDQAYTITVQYYARIPQLVNNDDTLLIPIEFENYIILKAQFYLLDLFHHERSAEKFKYCENEMAKLIRVDEIHPDDTPRFRLPIPKSTFGTIYIKV